jgi:uncharacterized protein (DUF433 family)
MEGERPVQDGRMGSAQSLEFVGQNQIRLKGHRIGLEHLVERYLDGFGVELIAQEFPGLSPDTIKVAIGYYIANQSAVDAYLARLSEEAETRQREDAQSESPVARRLRSLKARRQPV